jgi:hypothetical protein
VSDSTRLTREQLYDRVWSTPAWKLGPELGMSGRGLAKRCAREGIPVTETTNRLYHRFVHEGAERIGRSPCDPACRQRNR